MKFFSKEIKNFLTGIDSNNHIAIVPRSQSSATAGDLVFFRYSLGTGAGSRSYRIFLLTEPITKQAKTGNLLLTGFRLKNLGSDTFTALDVISLYNNVNTTNDKLGSLTKSRETSKNYLKVNKTASKPKLTIKLQNLKSSLLRNKIESEYRTYIMTKIFGPIRKLIPPAIEEEGSKE